MRRTLRDLSDARKELLEIEQDFVHIQKRIDALRDCVMDSLTRIFGQERPAFAALAEEELIEKLAGRVAARLGTAPRSQARGQQRYVRDVEAAAFLGVRVGTLRGWRSRGEPCGPPVTRMGRMVMYSMKGLEQYMEERTVERR
jgi:hypothetical protein